MVLTLVVQHQGPGQTLPEYIPNDPKRDLAHARAINLLQAYAKILEIEQNSTPKMSQAVMVFLDEWVDCMHPEFIGTCLPQHAFNATDRGWQNGELHGMAAAGTGGAATDNNKGISTPNFMNRLKFIPMKVCEGNLCRPEWAQAALTRVLELKRSGVPIVVVGCNFASGVVDNVGMDRLLRELDNEQVDIVAPDNNAGPSFNMDEFLVFPASYARQYPNIIAVTAGDSTAERPAPFSTIGPKTLSLVAPGINVKTISTLDPNNDSGSISGASAVTQQITAILGLIRIYREANSAKARFILKFTARMFPEWEGRLNASPGNSDDAGRMAGRVDVYDALTMVVGCPPPTSAVLWVTKRENNKLIALDSVTMTSGPFAVSSDQNHFAPDRFTRLMLFAYNVGANASVLTIHAQDSRGTTAQLPIEFAAPLSNSTELNCVSQIVVKLHSQLASGEVNLTLTRQGQSSTQGAINIR